MLQVQPKMLYVPLAILYNNIFDNDILTNQQILERIHAKTFTCYDNPSTPLTYNLFLDIDCQNYKFKNAVELYENNLICIKYSKNSDFKNVLTMLDGEYPDNYCVMVNNLSDYIMARQYLPMEDVYDTIGNHYYA